MTRRGPSKQAPYDPGPPIRGRLRLVDFSKRSDRALSVHGRIWMARWRRDHVRIRDVIQVRRAVALLDDLLRAFEPPPPADPEAITDPAQLLELLDGAP